MVEHAARQLCRLNRRFRLRGLGRVLRRLAAYSEALRAIPVPMTDGRVLYLDLRDSTCLTYYLFGEIPTDRWETAFVRSVMKPGEAAIDVGAFVGWYSTLLAEAVGLAGEVHAF